MPDGDWGARSSSKPLRCARSSVDIASGFHTEKAIRSAILATRLARAHDLDDAEQSDAFYLALVRFLGCTSFAPEAARFGGGDDLSVGTVMGFVDPDEPLQLVGHVFAGVGEFLVDTWLTFGLEVGAIGAALLVASRYPRQARGVVWTVLGIELTRGILNDVYLLARGYRVSVYAIWIVVHTLVIVTGLRCLRMARGGDEAEARMQGGSPTGAATGSKAPHQPPGRFEEGLLRTVVGDGPIPGPFPQTRND